MQEGDSSLLRALASIAALAIAVLLAGCGSSSAPGPPAQSRAQHPSQASTSTAPPGAAARACHSPLGAVGQLRAAGTGCSIGRVIAIDWRNRPACSSPSAASRRSCTVSGYLCLAATTDAGIAVSCAKEGRAISFIDKRG
ncbi:MAG: hypothetical protein WB507_05550 [Solirubrobacterales bacterium]